MFNTIIYFIVVLFVFQINIPNKDADMSSVDSLLSMLLLWAVFCIICRVSFRRLETGHKNGIEGLISAKFHGLIFRLSITAIILFMLNVFLFQLKLWILQVPGISSFSVIQGLLALGVFLFYLTTIWYFAFPVYRRVFDSGTGKSSYILSNLRLNLPVLFPWMILSLSFDLISLGPSERMESILVSQEGQLLFFSVFLVILIVFMPVLIQYFWGCREFEESEKLNVIKNFFSKTGFKYRRILKWPAFEGRMLTAGIMGVVPRFRYILVTESLMDLLSSKEITAVMAHEEGHARYRHQILYGVLFAGYLVLSASFFDSGLYPVIIGYVIGKFSQTPVSSNIFLTLSAVPLLITLVIYFRFIMGFFMRHFERQADLYSSGIMGTPFPIISSLEKIALYSGKIRDLPSWHHFSIRERVEYLQSAHEKPILRRRHNRLLFSAFAVYIASVVLVAYAAWFTQIGERTALNLIKKGVYEQLAQRPEDSELLRNLAMLYVHMERETEAVMVYEKLLALNKMDAEGLNNLAWILITAKNEKLRDIERGLFLAKKAVSMEPNPVFLDTLAEAYSVNGNREKAVEVITKAIEIDGSNDKYLLEQLDKFSGSGE